jgi:hypothetical protein
MRPTYLMSLLLSLCGLGCGDPATDMPMTPAGPNFPLTVTAVAGGRITSTPAGIDCGGTCTYEFPRGTRVELKAEVDSEHVFLRWGDACEGDRPCVLVMNEALTLRAVVEDSYRCTQDGWCQRRPAPGTDNLWIVELLGDKDAVVGGDKLIRGDGVQWSPLSLNLGGAALQDSAVRSRAPLDVWLLPDDGTLRRWDGQGFTTLDTAGSTKALWGAWFADPNDGWLVGNTGTILRWNGTKLTPMESGTQSILYSVWGNAANDVWMVSVDGNVHHWDGVRITSQPSGATDDLNDVWASGPNDVWVVGNGGLIIHFDGTSWTKTESGTTEHIIACYGDKKDVWAVGEKGVILHHDGTAWRREESGVQTGLRQLRISDKEVWVVGFAGVILRKQR